VAAAAAEPPGGGLRHAAELGDLAQLEAFARGQPDLNARDARGRTALMLATVNGHADAVAALLAYGADPHLADAQGVTPLAAARAAGNAEIVAIFARYGLR
jgi:ankyrin repeat protein